MNSPTDVIRIVNGSLSYDDQLKAGFYGPNGWSMEPVTSHLCVDGKTIGKIFPHQNDDLCVTAYNDLLPVGHCNANNWSYHLDQLPCNLHALKDHQHQGTQKFITLLRIVVSEEWVGLRPFLLAQGLTMGQIAHRCGLMTTQPGQKNATKMVEASDLLLKEKEFKAVVVKTTNIGSRRVFEKNGYTVHKAFDLSDFGIDLKDQYTILYKIF